MNSVKRKAALVLGLVAIVIGCWIHWEAVVKPLRDKTGWEVFETLFPAPFYLFRAPVWFWHDLAYTLIIAGTIVLALLGCVCSRNEVRG